MPGKVSLVVPCYNKEEYVAEMFDSVIAQHWDNVEVILVNDGSTDGTRDIIAQYEPKFLARGYELKVIDQKNGGCCAAVHAGLLEISGDYFCLADCDDALYPEYMSKMAGFLEENPEYDLCACTFNHVLMENGERVISPPLTYSRALEDGVEQVILHNTITAVWNYAVRADYLKKTRLIENFNTERNRTYEPLFAIPYLAGGGKLKFLPEPLYFFNCYSNGLSHLQSIVAVRNYFDDKKRQYEWALSKLDARIYYKKWLSLLVEGAHHYCMAIFSCGVYESNAECREDFQCILNEYSIWISSFFRCQIDVDAEDVASQIVSSWQRFTDIVTG